MPYQGLTHMRTLRIPTQHMLLLAAKVSRKPSQQNFLHKRERLRRPSTYRQ